MPSKKRWFYDSVRHGEPLDPVEIRLIEERTGVYVSAGMVGPWQAGDKKSTYYVINVETGEKKKMGRAGMKGINWWLRAKEEARHRNELVENQKNYPWLFRKGGKAGVMKELEQVLYVSRIGGLPRQPHEVVDEAYSRCEIAGCTTKDLNKVLARVDERVKAGDRIVGGGKKRHSSKQAPKRGVKWKHFPEGYTAVLHDYKGNMLDAMTYQGWHKKPPLKQRKITEALLLATDINKLLK